MAVDRRPRAYRSTPASDPQVRLLRQAFIDEFLRFKPDLQRELRRLLPLYAQVRNDVRFVEDRSERPVWGRYGWAELAFSAEILCTGGDRCRHCGVRELESRVIACLGQCGLDLPWVRDTALNTLERWHDRERVPEGPKQDVQEVASALEKRSDELGIEQHWTPDAVDQARRALGSPEHLSDAKWIVPPSEPRNLAEFVPVLEFRCEHAPGESIQAYRKRLEKAWEAARTQHLAELAAGTRPLPLPAQAGAHLRWLAQWLADSKAEAPPLSIAKVEKVSLRTVERRAIEMAGLIGIPLRIKRGRPRNPRRRRVGKTRQR